MSAILDAAEKILNLYTLRFDRLQNWALFFFYSKENQLLWFGRKITNLLKHLFYVIKVNRRKKTNKIKSIQVTYTLTNKKREKKLTLNWTKYLKKNAMKLIAMDFVFRFPNQIGMLVGWYVSTARFNDDSSVIMANFNPNEPRKTRFA